MVKGFKTHLVEGGNVMVGDVQAQNIDVTKIDRKKFVEKLVDDLLVLNKKFESKYGMKIWNDESFVRSGKVFSGSSEHFVNLDISDEEFKKYKPSVGDIDIQVSDQIEKMLHEFFKKNKKFGALNYMGQSTTAIGQISSLFEFQGLKIQIDFEFVEVDGSGLPTPWSSFSHSSSWDDMVKGVKGVFHKFIIGDIDKAFSVDLMIKKGKVRPTYRKERAHLFAFSVKNGLRPKYRKTDEKYRGQEVWVQLTPKEATYTKDIEDIYSKLFRTKPARGDLEKFYSFTGILDLIDKSSMKKTQKTELIDGFANKLWGRGSQGLYRNDPKRDAEMKFAAWDQIEIVLGVGKNKYKELIDTYYRNYK